MNLTKTSFYKKAALSVMLTLIAASPRFVVVSCKKGEAESKPADVDYYTCAMHPSVRSQDPHGKCPICSMDLVPVKKNTAPGDQTERDCPARRKCLEAEQPSEFTVPVGRQQQIGVTFGKVEIRRFHHDDSRSGHGCL